MSKVACVAFTKKAMQLARRVRDALAKEGYAVSLCCPVRLIDGPDARELDDVYTWARCEWQSSDALLFVSACGIATRAIAPLVSDKYHDPAVVCMDEAARFVVPLLSGHVGGANELARRVARICGAQAVISTATDVNRLFAVDEWAREQGLVVLDRNEAKRVSATLLEGSTVGFASDFYVAGELPRGVVRDDRAVGFCVSYDPGKRPFAHTLRLVPRTVVVGVGCKRGTSAEAILEQIESCLEQARVDARAVCGLASIDIKADEKGLLKAAAQRGWATRFYDAQTLGNVPGEFHSSEFVRQAVGVDNVCERAACADGATLLLGKRGANGVTVAIAATTPKLSFDCGVGVASQQAGGHVACVGIGPGGADGLTLRAHRELLAAQVIVGYTTYVGLIRNDYPQAEYVTTGMRGEVQRCKMALERAAAGQRVAVVCSGDPGVYGMAGLLYELAPEYPGVRVDVVPGVSAANGGAAVLGAPLMHDWCSISLSDLMTPWDTIEARLRAAAQADFCIVLYNPASRWRADHLRRACDVLLELKSADTVCGLVRSIGRAGQKSQTLTLGELRDVASDMLTCVFVGNSQTRLVDGHMVTPRGYMQKEE